MSPDDDRNGLGPSHGPPAPTLEGRARLATALDLDRARHPIDAGTLGEYVELLDRVGLGAARDAFPSVAAHLAAGCDACNEDVRDLRELASLDAWDGDDARFSQDAHLGQSMRPPLTDTPLADGARGSLRHAPHDTMIGASRASAPRRGPPTLVTALLAVAAIALVVMGGTLLTLMTAAQQGRSGEIKLVQRGTETLEPIGPSAGVPQGAPSTNIGSGSASTSPATAGVPATDGGCPDAYPLKANRDSRIYHPRGGQFYERTRAELCFARPEDAERAGFRRSQR